MVMGRKEFCSVLCSDSCMSSFVGDVDDQKVPQLLWKTIESISPIALETTTVSLAKIVTTNETKLSVFLDSI